MYNICVLCYVQHKNLTQTMTHAHSMVDRCYIYSKLHTCTLNATTDSNMYTHTYTIAAFGASALMITTYVCHMFRVLTQNYTTCEGYTVIDAACTKYKLNSKRVLVQLQTVCVVLHCTNCACSGLVQHSTH